MTSVVEELQEISQSDANPLLKLLHMRSAIRRAVFRSLASLKVTVALFAMSIFLVLAGTLAQVDQNMWEIINNYFHSDIVWIRLQVFFPKTWFPNHQNIAGQFPYPGGFTLGAVLFVNLLAAHAIRFKPQAKDGRLVFGLLVLLLGLILTAMVIMSGHVDMGMQGEPLLSWATMWFLVKFGLAITTVGLFVGFFVAKAREHANDVEVGTIGVSAILMLLFVLWLFFSGAYLGDAGMRILWQLLKCAAVSFVVLVGCILIFKKRAGIVVIHGGIGLLMIGELLTSFATEQRIAIDEGDTVSHSIDIRSTELAIVDSSQPDKDDVVVVPMWVKGRPSSFLRDGKAISHEDLPFDIEIIDYYRNSDLMDVGPHADNKATAGKGLRTVAKEVRSGSGADASSEVDMASSYVRFMKKGSTDEIGTYLVSQVVLQSRSGGLFTFDENVAVDDKTYHVELRFKRSYKPYSLRLIDVRKDDYIGTNTPKNYSSDVQLVDDSRNVDRQVKIWMNNPLRYAGETFYQSGYHADASGVESTTLQVVKNTGWMIPYVSCVLVMFGMFAHFSGTLLRFLNRVTSVPAAPKGPVEMPIVAEQTRESPQSKANKKGKPQRSEPVELATPLSQRDGIKPPSVTVSIVLTAIVVLVFGGWLAGKARPAKAKSGQMDVYSFGKLPLAFEGRVKPFDTLARNSLRVVSTKERLKDNIGIKQPAIVWLLDVISGSDAGLEHQVFKIDNLELLDTLKLTRRKGGLYSMNEVEPQMEEFRRQVKLAGEVPPEQMSVYQKKVLELDSKLQLFFKLREAFRMPEEGLGPDEEIFYLAGMANVSQQLTGAAVPYAIPTSGDETEEWEPFSVAITRLWAKELAAKYDVRTATEFANKVASELYSEQRIEERVEERILGLIKQITGENVPEAQLDAYAREMLTKMPEAQRESITKSIRAEIDDESRQVRGSLAATLTAAVGDGDLSAIKNAPAQAMWDMLRAYRDSDEHAFTRAMDSYNAALETSSPESLNRGKTNFEAAFNNFAPFYNCAALYVFAFVLTALGWLLWPFRLNKPFNWAAFGLITMTFLVHSAALLGRMYISGRPPVTNLYSSAIFIGWGVAVFGIVLELLFRIGIGNIISAVAGFSTLVIAHQLAGDGDTFTVLQAVLDTQFWLATHVVTITLGYATTFAAGLLGVLFVFAGIGTPALSERVGQYTIRKALANMIYGIVCFALFFSFVGTVLGGLWADDSWGRFWGWDPKENGALIIVLWNAVILHARWGKMVGDRGMALLAIGGNMVTAWSWFGVNELGVGLHSYGFTEGVMRTLVIFWANQLVVIAIGLVPTSLWWSYRVEEQQRSGKATPAQVVA